MVGFVFLLQLYVSALVKRKRKGEGILCLALDLACNMVVLCTSCVVIQPLMQVSFQRLWP